MWAEVADPSFLRALEKRIFFLGDGNRIMNTRTLSDHIKTVVLFLCWPRPPSPDEQTSGQTYCSVHWITKKRCYLRFSSPLNTGKY